MESDPLEKAVKKARQAWTLCDLSLADRKVGKSRMRAVKSNAANITVI